MSENKKWRCPYCDGLNDCQNEVCEICGDGRREEAIHETKKAEEPISSATATKTTPEKQTPPPEHKSGSVSATESFNRSNPTRSSSREDIPLKTETKARKKTSIWIPLLLILIIAGGGWFLIKGGFRESPSANQSAGGAGNGQASAVTYEKMENAPEIIGLSWNEKEKTVDITFRKNGCTGEFHESSHYGRTTDTNQLGFGDEIKDDVSSEVITVSTKSGYFIPGEWQTFDVSVEEWEGNLCKYALSEPKEIQIPINRNMNEKAVREYYVAPIKATELEKLKAAYNISYEEYKKYKEAHRQQIIQADVDVGDRTLKAMITSPSGFVTVDTIYSSSPFDDALISSFAFFLPIEKGKYTVRFYDWENLCLADPDTFVFTVE